MPSAWRGDERQRSGVENPHVVVYSDRAELKRASGGIGGHAGPIHDEVGRQTPHLEEHPVTAKRHADARFEQLGLEMAVANTAISTGIFIAGLRR